MHEVGGASKNYINQKLPEFDVLVDMARNNPQRLKNLRRELPQGIIASATTEQKRKRLEVLQFRVEFERQRARSPLAATVKLLQMMAQSLAELHRSMVTPLENNDSDVSKTQAQVLDFPLASGRGHSKV